MTDQSRTPSEWEKCGHCGFLMHPSDTVRYFGKYHAHLEARCRDLMRGRISTLELEAADLRERLAKAREEARNQARESLSVIEAILKSLTHPTPPTATEWAELRGIARAHLATIEAQKGADHE